MNTGDYLGKFVPGPALFVAMIAAASVMLAAGCVRAGADAGGICALETVDVKTGARTVVKPAARNCARVDFGDLPARRHGVRRPVEFGEIPRRGFVEVRMARVELAHKVQMTDDIEVA